METGEVAVGSLVVSGGMPRHALSLLIRRSTVFRSLWRSASWLTGRPPLEPSSSGWRPGPHGVGCLGVQIVDDHPGAGLPRGSADRLSHPSTVEDRPADLVSPPLIVQDEFANHIRELIALPTALEPAGALTLLSGGRRTHRLDRVGRSAELLCGDMRDRCRLAGSICGVPSGSAQLSCRSHGMATRRSGLRHPDLAARPCPNLLDRLAGPRVRGLHRLEEVQNVLRARGSPDSQQPMVGVRKRPPTPDGDEAGVTSFGKNHGAPRDRLRA